MPVIVSNSRLYRWENFTEGNLAALKAGVYSERIMAPLAQSIFEMLLSDRPYLNEPRFLSAVHRLAGPRPKSGFGGVRSEIGLDKLTEDQARRKDRAEYRSAKLDASLGGDPMSDARIRRDLAAAGRDTAGVAALLEEGARIREQRRLANTHQRSQDSREDVELADDAPDVIDVEEDRSA